MNPSSSYPTLREMRRELRSLDGNNRLPDLLQIMLTDLNVIVPQTPQASSVNPQPSQSLSYSSLFGGGSQQPSSQNVVFGSQQPNFSSSQTQTQTQQPSTPLVPSYEKRISFEQDNEFIDSIVPGTSQSLGSPWKYLFRESNPMRFYFDVTESRWKLWPTITKNGILQYKVDFETPPVIQRNKESYFPNNSDDEWYKITYAYAAAASSPVLVLNDPNEIEAWLRGNSDVEQDGNQKEYSTVNGVVKTGIYLKLKGTSGRYSAGMRSFSTPSGQTPTPPFTGQSVRYVPYTRK